jgi:hypothetical protein
MEKTTTQQKIRGSKFARIVLAGIIGTIAFNGVMYADIAITGIPLDIVATMGNLAVGESENAEIIGHIIHFANGIGLSLLFGYVALPISKKIIKLPVIVYAIIFVIVELVIAVWFAMLPMLGAGIAGLNIGPEVAVMTFVRHVVFGVVLGLVLRGESTK